MTDALYILTGIALLLLGGLIITIISNKLKISNVLLLIILGIGLRAIKYNGTPIIEFSSTFLLAISILALAMITFDGASRFKLKEVDQFSGDAVKVFLWFVFTNIILITIFTLILFFPNFSTEYIIISLMFAVMMAATDPAAIFSMMKGKVNKVIEVLEIESIINTPFIVIIPFILLDFLKATGSGQLFNSFIEQIVPFLQQIIVGVGAGVVVGIIIFKAMRNVYHHQLSPLAIIVAALLAYVLAENLGGNGVLSVATMGLLFGNVYVKEKFFLKEFSSIFSNSLEILVFVMLGFLVEMSFTTDFFIKSITLFFILVLARWFAITFALKGKDYDLKEKLFMTFNMPKGIAVAAVVFSLSMRSIEGLGVIIDLVLIFMIYSLVLSTVTDLFANRMIQLSSQAQKET
ncbi:MAG: cation:proton antiporter [archaeon]